jgi:hypothetical protein
MKKEQAHAVIDEVWRQRFSSGNLPTDLYNLVGDVKAQLHRDIDAIPDEDEKVPLEAPDKD